MSSVTFFADKKGVSPLIATVLLIAFAVALGAVIMNWGRSFVQERTDDIDTTTIIETGCAQEVRLKVSVVGGTPQVCFGGGGTSGHIQFTLDNFGRREIKRVNLVVGGKLDVYTNQSLNNSKIIEGGSIFQNVSYNYVKYGNIDYIRFIPSIDVAGATRVCAGAFLQKDASEIRNCSAT